MISRADSPVVEVVGLTKRYGASRGVSELDLAVEHGEIYGFIGPNGAGKTTTIRLLLDLIRPTSGEARIFGLDAHTQALLIHQEIGYLPAELALVDSLTGAEFLDWIGRLRAKTEAVHTARLADRFDLDLSRRIGDLSTGNRRKIGLVQALMHRPKLLILDEPTSGLDPVMQREFQALITELRSTGTTIFLSSHALSEVESVCDRVAVIVDGRIEQTLSLDELIGQHRRELQIEFGSQLVPSGLETIEGVRGVTIEQPGQSGAVVSFAFDGSSMGELLRWIADSGAVDVLSRPISLEEVFLDEFTGPTQRDSQ